MTTTAERSMPPQWQYLMEHPHPWRRQLYVKGRRLPAAQVWERHYHESAVGEEAADNWNLPIEAIREIVRYCEENKTLLGMEAEEERRRLLEAKVALSPLQDSSLDEKAA